MHDQQSNNLGHQLETNFYNVLTDDINTITTLGLNYCENRTYYNYLLYLNDDFFLVRYITLTRTIFTVIKTLITTCLQTGNMSSQNGKYYMKQDMYEKC